MEITLFMGRFRQPDPSDFAPEAVVASSLTEVRFLENCPEDLCSVRVTRRLRAP
jgi:hypothetical protein